ncbi:Hypothetical predicted protein, partial [Pelobates cultripes]
MSQLQKAKHRSLILERRGHFGAHLICKSFHTQGLQELPGTLPLSTGHIGHIGHLCLKSEIGWHSLQVVQNNTLFHQPYSWRSYCCSLRWIFDWNRDKGDILYISCHAATHCDQLAFPIL